MGKKKREHRGADLVAARVTREEDWALEAWRARVPYPEMRRLALRPVDEGGLGYALTESALRGLVQAARARHGETVMTRADRIERQQEEIDERARRARYDLAKAHAMTQTPPPDERPDETPLEYAKRLEVWAKMIEGAHKAVESADRRLAAAMKDEREIHGDNAATKIEAEVTTRDGVLDELNEAIIALGGTPVEKVPA